MVQPVDDRSGPVPARAAHAAAVRLRAHGLRDSRHKLRASCAAGGFGVGSGCGRVATGGATAGLAANRAGFDGPWNGTRRCRAGAGGAVPILQQAV